MDSSLTQRPAAYLLLKEHMEGQDGEETEVSRHRPSEGVLEVKEVKD